jgi:hypothetical protein
MTNDIDRLAVFPIIKKGDYLFRCSISNRVNIMIIAQRQSCPGDLVIKFFSDSKSAESWVNSIADESVD